MSEQDTSLRRLEAAAITVAALSGLFGVYLILFFSGLWSTYRRNTTLNRRLRVVSIILFVTLLAHFISRSLQFSRARQRQTSDEELLIWGIPLLFVATFTTTLAGLLSNGVLAWRFYIVLKRQAWAKWIPGISIVINACLNFAASGQLFAAYSNYDDIDTFYRISRKLTIAWGWFMFAINSSLTSTILWKILSIANRCHPHSGSIGSSSTTYKVVLHALIESAFVTWVGVVLSTVCGLTSAGHLSPVQEAPNLGYILGGVLPVFFGISQSLITLYIGSEQKDDPQIEVQDASSSFHVPEPQFSVRRRSRPISHTISTFINAKKRSLAMASIPQPSLYQETEDTMDISKERSTVYDIQSPSHTDGVDNIVIAARTEQRMQPHPFALSYSWNENSALSLGQVLNRERSAGS